MNRTTHTSTLEGINAQPVQVEAELTNGLPAFDIAGLADNALRETRTRVRAGMEQSGYPFPLRRVTVTLSATEGRKSLGYDLAIAVAIAVAMGECSGDLLDGWLLLGELSLTGAVRGVRGVLPQVLTARDRGFRGVIVPWDNAPEAAEVAGIEVRVGSTLREVVDFLSGRGELLLATPHAAEGRPDHQLDLRDVKGQEQAKRALEIAAAGGHNILFVGPPGAGKTLLARAMTGLLPPMTRMESMEATVVHSVAGMLRPGVGLLSDRPFRAPHHTASAAGLAGGGDPPRPGEVSLAHNGVLFIDELPEFPRESMEALREPMADRHITLVRARSRSQYPARFTLVAASNPCPCGYRGDASGRCDCPADRVKRYLSRFPQPMMDRIELMVTLPQVPASTLTQAPTGPTSAEVRERVQAARARAVERRGCCNADLGAQELTLDVKLDAEGARVRMEAGERLGLAGAQLRNVLKVARTIADLDGSETVTAAHLTEALQYRVSLTADAA